MSREVIAKKTIKKRFRMTILWPLFQTLEFNVGICKNCLNIFDKLTTLIESFLNKEFLLRFLSRLCLLLVTYRVRISHHVLPGSSYRVVQISSTGCLCLQFSKESFPTCQLKAFFVALMKEEEGLCNGPPHYKCHS